MGVSHFNRGTFLSRRKGDIFNEVQHRAILERGQLTRIIIERLIGAAILAPSAMNLQPWAFAALLDHGRIGRFQPSYSRC